MTEYNTYLTINGQDKMALPMYDAVKIITDELSSRKFKKFLKSDKSVYEIKYDDIKWSLHREEDAETVFCIIKSLQFTYIITNVGEEEIDQRVAKNRKTKIDHIGNFFYLSNTNRIRYKGNYLKSMIKMFKYLEETEYFEIEECRPRRKNPNTIY